MSEIKEYIEDDIITLDWKEHIRRRPGMYIGKLGDGASPDDGIYVLLKEVIDNSIDEYTMGYGKRIDITINEDEICVRDYGRGIPLGALVDATSKMNTGAKYDSEVFKKSVGLNGVGIKAVNALSSKFCVESIRENKSRSVVFECGNLIEDLTKDTNAGNGTNTIFTADKSIFGNYTINKSFIETMVKNYTYLNIGLTITFNGVNYISKYGLLDLLNENMSEEPLYPPVYLKGDDIEVVITHGSGYGDTCYSFVNGQHTTQGGTHLSAFREAIGKTIRDFYKKDFDTKDICMSMYAAISIKVLEPVFESQTKTKLGSRDMSPNGKSIRTFVIDFLSEELDKYLHKNKTTSEIILKKIQESEKERKTISGIQKIARERAKKASLHNKKLRDCRVHYNDKHTLAESSTLFITEGDSASGSITKSRDVNTQAVFSLRGKPLNTYGKTKRVVYENEEFNLLQAALNIEESIDNLRYNKIVIATDADVDGMHIRLLMLTFFLQFFPDVIRLGHLYILQTPLFRVRKIGTRTSGDTKSKKGDVTYYCYNEDERQKAINALGEKAEITRFKGLGEISPDEFEGFIGENIRIDRVHLSKDDSIRDLLEFYMGENTPERKDFIVNRLRYES
ncbi:MAG: type IIA DNA topoisomerase subunit B [Prevotellaceae bacterium]|jgi:topoisomerase-4 subunit B|nr:type IIA DNA topoisomerase subunit B [Prevotellaceae bacterium]